MLHAHRLLHTTLDRTAKAERVVETFQLFSLTGQKPSELFQNYLLRTWLDLMLFDLGGKVFDKQSDQKSKIDEGSKEPEFTIGEQVLVPNFRGEPEWLDGTFTEHTGPV